MDGAAAGDRLVAALEAALALQAVQLRDRVAGALALAPAPGRAEAEARFGAALRALAADVAAEATADGQDRRTQALWMTAPAGLLAIAAISARAAPWPADALGPDQLIAALADRQGHDAVAAARGFWQALAQWRPCWARCALARLAQEQYQLDTGERSARHFRLWLVFSVAMVAASLLLADGAEITLETPLIAAGGVVAGLAVGWVWLRWRLGRHQRRRTALARVLGPAMTRPLSLAQIRRVEGALRDQACGHPPEAGTPPPPRPPADPGPLAAGGLGRRLADQVRTLGAVVSPPLVTSMVLPHFVAQAPVSAIGRSCP